MSSGTLTFQMIAQIILHKPTNLILIPPFIYRIRSQLQNTNIYYIDKVSKHHILY